MKLLRLGLVAGVVALLAACATPPKRPPLPDDVAADLQQRREAALAPDRDWALQGRVAVSGGREGGSARIEWRQQGRDFDVWLRAPVTRQSWRLQRQGTQVRLEGLAGGPRLGADAEALLFRATGWTIPMDAMASWVRGLRADPRAATGLRYDAQGRLLGFVEDGWTIGYELWEEGDGLHAMPLRLSAQREASRVKLVVDAWTADPITP